MINAGDGTHEHPTQALLDALTIRQRLGSIEGKRVVIVGDVLHSRVARSNVLLLDTLGAEVVLVAPPTLLPVGVADWPVTVSHDLDAELPIADAVLMLRVQAERMNGGFFPSAREYSVLYGLSEKRQAMLPGNAVVLHPGPMVRGMEIAFSVADSTQSAVLQQVSNGVHIRMAVLFHLLVGARAGGDQRMSVLIRGVRLYGEGDRVDVLVSDGQIADIGADLPSPTTPTSSTPPIRSCFPASSTCTPTCVSPAGSTPRTSKPVRQQRLWVATPRCSRWPTPTRSPTAPSSPTTSGTAANRSGWSTCIPSARSPWGWLAPNSPKWA